MTIHQPDQWRFLERGGSKKMPLTLRKLRPVGSRVPKPLAHRKAVLPWRDNYATEYTDSGTSALSLAIALASANRPDRKRPEVILPAYGCPDLIAAVVAQGARPVLVDLQPDRPWLDADGVESAISEQTVALIAVDFLGLPERLKLLSGICDGAGIALIEDSAQHFPPSAMTHAEADFVVLSFGRGKPINLMGGGALLIRRDLFGDSVGVLERYPESVQVDNPSWHLRRGLFNLLLSRPLYGLLERLPLLGIGETRFKPLEAIERRHPVEGLLAAGLESFWQRPLVQQRYSLALADLEAAGWERLPVACRPALSAGMSDEPQGQEAPLLRYSLLAPSKAVRDLALKALNRKGISANAFYGQPLPLIAGVGPYLGTEPSCPEAQSFAERLLTLPTHEDVTPRDIATIAETLSRL